MNEDQKQIDQMHGRDEVLMEIDADAFDVWFASLKVVTLYDHHIELQPCYSYDMEEQNVCSIKE